MLLKAGWAYWVFLFLKGCNTFTININNLSTITGLINVFIVHFGNLAI